MNFSGEAPLEYLGPDGHNPNISKPGVPRLSFPPREDFGGARLEFVPLRIAEAICEQYNRQQTLFQIRYDILNRQQLEVLKGVVQSTVVETLVGFGLIKPEDAAKQTSEEPPATEDEVKASHHARKLAEELGVSLADVTPSGEDGTISKQDVENHVASTNGQAGE